MAESIVSWRWNGGTIGARDVAARCGANPARDAGSAELDRASPSANPVGSTQGGLVELKRGIVRRSAVRVRGCPRRVRSREREHRWRAARTPPSSRRSPTSRASRAARRSTPSQPGSLLRVRGTALRAVRKVVFLGARGVGRRRRRRGASRAPEERRRPRAGEGAQRAADGDQRRRRAVRRQPRRGVRTAREGRRRRARRARRRPARVPRRRAPGALDLLARESMGVAVALVRLSDGASSRAGRSACSAGAVQHRDLGRDGRRRVAADRPLRVPRLQPGRRRAGRAGAAAARDGRVRPRRPQVPGPRQAHLRHGHRRVRRRAQRPIASGPRHLRRVRHAARRRSRRRREAQPARGPTPATTSSSTAPARTSTTPTCTCRSARR